MTTTVQSSLEIEYKNAIWIGQWIKYPTSYDANGHVNPDRYLILGAKTKEGLIQTADRLSMRTQDMDAIRDLLCRKRIKQIQRAYGVSKFEDDILAKAVLNRVKVGDWMGQSVHNQEFTVETLAAILHKNVFDTMLLVEEFKEEWGVLLKGNSLIHITD